MKRSTKKKAPLSPLDLELRALGISANRARNQMMFHPSLRIWGKLAEFFGHKTHDPELARRAVTLKDVDIWEKQLTEIIKDKHASYHYIAEESLSQRVELIDPSEIEIIEPKPEQESSTQSTYNPKYPKQKANLLYYQKDAAKELWDGYSLRNLYSQMLISPTQTGKTFIAGSLIENFIEQGWIEKLQCFAPWPIWYLTRATLLEQTRNVLNDYFHLPMAKIKILNIEAISRGQFGKHFAKEDVVIIDGAEHVKYVWTPLMHPCLVIGDECHMFIRAHSLQTSMFMGLTEMPNVRFMFMSATPLSRVSEGKVFACSTRKTFQLGLAEVPITNVTWPAFAKQVAAPADPTEHTVAAKERYVEFFKENIVKTRNIRPKHKATTQIMPITFRTKEEYDFYNKALERYYKQKAEIEGNEHLGGGESQMALLAAFTILRHAAEECKVDQMVEFILKTWDAGYAPFMGLAFKRPITNIIRALIQKHGWKREDISVIWGGSQETLNNKKKLAQQINKHDALKEALGKAGISLDKLGIKLDELNEKTEDQLAFEREYKLLSQDRQQREEERLRYKKQDSRLLLYSYKSGGVGLSASHEEGFGDKTRPRQGCLSLVYNEKELVQGIGRPHAITSISETLILFPYYQGTIEEDVAAKVQQKLKCLRAGTGVGESWENMFASSKLQLNAENVKLFTAIEDAEEAEEVVSEMYEVKG
jgi:hypothetical protein